MPRSTYWLAPSRQRGFSLIELMIVIAIVAILAGVAYPAYTDYLKRGRRAEATGTLTALAAAQEQYFLTYKSYTSANLGYPSSENGYYDISVALGANRRTYTLSATPAGVQVVDNDGGSDDCGVFRINQVGTKTVTGAEAVDTCW
jgi:type IV pilus assembly protein PilE